MHIELDHLEEQQEQAEHKGHLQEARNAAWESGGTQSRDTHGANGLWFTDCLSLSLSTLARPRKTAPPTCGREMGVSRA